MSIESCMQQKMIQIIEILQIVGVWECYVDSDDAVVNTSFIKFIINWLKLGVMVSIARQTLHSITLSYLTPQGEYLSNNKYNIQRCL